MNALTPTPIGQPLPPMAAVPVAVSLPAAAPMPVVPVVSVMPAVVAMPSTGFAAFRFAALSVARNFLLRATGKYVPDLDALEASGASVMARDALASASAEVSQAAAMTSAAVPARSVAPYPAERKAQYRYQPSAELMRREAVLTTQNGGVRVFITTPIDRDCDQRLDFNDGVVAVVWRGVGEHHIVERRMSASGTPATLMLPDDTKFVHLLPIKVHRYNGRVTAVMTTR